MIDNKFSELLARKLIKITDIANNTGISRTTLTNLYYRRTKYISLEVLDKICKYLDCTVEDIIEFNDDI